MEGVDTSTSAARAHLLALTLRLLRSAEGGLGAVRGHDAEGNIWSDPEAAAGYGRPSAGAEAAPAVLVDAWRANPTGSV
ncbi:hypothetical protein [Pseudonocardia nigra]|uniref:hypothetical protein n=1 Tax=Pseudonocardia nigra TaxID=1921578 RepID=UPI001C5EC1BF|nr:hypothetical protein [Pseudonocardia nigra]